MFVSARHKWTPEVEAIFHDLLGEHGYFLSGTPYSKGKKKHIITQEIWHDESVSPDLFLRLSYDASDRVESVDIPKEDQRESEFLSRVSSADVTWQMLSNVEFEVLDVDEASLWFPLPTRIGGTGDSAEVFEITGVRGAKLADPGSDQWEYNFELDSSPRGGVFIDIYFPDEGRFTIDWPNHALNRGMVIAKRLVGAEAMRRRKPT